MGKVFLKKNLIDTLLLLSKKYSEGSPYRYKSNFKEFVERTAKEDSKIKTYKRKSFF